LIILGELRTSHVLKMALVFFIGAVIAVLTNTTVVAERFAIWTYVLGIVAVTGSSISGRKKESADIPRVEQYIFRIGLVVIICLALGVSVYQIGSYGRKILLPRSANNTTVSYVGPSKNYTQGSGITQGFEIIRGTGFGDRYDGSIHLMSDYGEIEEYSWSDTMIVFRIPTYWKVGKTNIWIGKNTKDSALIDVPVSGVYTISILDRSTAWDVTDDAYYRELLSAPGVVREVNGYTRGWYY